MASIKVCPNGHKYSAELPNCPFCPKSDPGANTQYDGSPANISPEEKSASKASEARPNAQQESVPENNRRTMIDSSSSSHVQKNQAERKTVIYAGNDNSSDSKSASATSGQGKLVGWLVTFTWNPLGVDYRIRAGKTRIGSSGDMDIKIPDGLVSGSHAQLLFRNGELKIRDNFSTNGTQVNGVDIGDSPHLLKDGDQIQMGNTHFILRFVETGSEL